MVKLEFHFGKSPHAIYPSRLKIGPVSVPLRAPGSLQSFEPARELLRRHEDNLLGLKCDAKELDRRFFDTVFLAARRLTQADSPLLVRELPHVREDAPSGDREWATPANYVKTLRRMFRQGALQLEKVGRDPGSVRIELVGIAPDQIRYIPDDLATKYQESFAKITGKKRKIGLEVLARINNEISNDSTQVNILATEGAVAWFVIDHILDSIVEGSSICRNMEISLFVSECSNPEYAYGRKQLASYLSRIVSDVAENTLVEPLRNHQRLVATLRERRVVLRVFRHPFTPLLHGLQVGRNWAACGVASLETKSGFPEPQITCADLTPNFVAVDQRSPLLATFRTWIDTLSTHDRLIASTDSDEHFAENLSQWVRKTHIGTAATVAPPDDDAPRPQPSI